MKTLRVASWLLSVVILLGGCHIGPKWETEVALPALLGDAPGKRIVVGRFLETHTTSSITHSAQITEMRESVRVHDNSVALATALRANGLDVEAREGVEPSDLAADQVLVRGGVIVSPYIGGTGAWIVGTCTIFIVGAVLPSPFPYVSGARAIYFVEVLDADGRWLMQTGDKRASVYFDSYYIYGAVSTEKTVKEDVAELVTEEIGKQLATQFR